MRERTSYVVSWAGDNLAGERRPFEEWDAALDYYHEISADRRTRNASLLEITERECRCFEKEPSYGHADEIASAVAPAPTAQR